MEKLPERWYVIPNTIEECKIVGRWFDKSVSGWGASNGPNFYENGCSVGMEMSNDYGFGIRTGAYKITFDQFKRLVLGETEKWIPKVGQYIVITSAHDTMYNAGDVVKIKSINNIFNHLHTADTGAHIVLKENCRPARPEEIPQEEVEYVECISQFGVMGFTVNKIYRCRGKFPTPYDSGKENQTVEYDSITWRGNFKPSTREAYEAQQRKQECDCFDGCIKCKKVNKCSTINTNQNECKNENKSIKVRGSSISISTVSRARGKSLCSSGGKISLGTYYSRNKQKPCNSKA